MSEQLNIKKKLSDKIYKLSKASGKNPSYHVNKALENYFEEIDDLNEAVKRLKDKRDPVLSSKEIRKSLGI